MKKLLYLPLGLFLFASCTKDLSSLNEQTKAASSVPAGALFASASRELSDELAEASVNINIFRFVVKHWAMVTYQDEVQYDFNTRFIPRTWWLILYRDVLVDLKDAARIVNEDALMSAGEKANKLAIVDALQVYAYSILVNTFGDVPYTEALNSQNLFPKYDDDAEIYADLMQRLSADIANMSTAHNGFAAEEDLINGGSMAKWIAFANTLQMKLGIVIADVNEGQARTAIETANASAISSNLENIVFNYLDADPNQNPLYADYVTGNRGDYVAAKDLTDVLTDLEDPRLSLFFTPNSSGIYRGGISGAVNAPFSDYAHPGTKMIEPSAPTVFMDYAETEFIRAEAVERQFSIPGSAAEHYNNAITASILYWGGTAADATAYLAQPEVNYATAAGTWKEKIGKQKWIALYNRPYDGWTEMRRLDFPKLSPPVGAVSGFPNRFTYPDTEQTTNGNSYTAAATAVGGDKVETKLFWDKF